MKLFILMIGIMFASVSQAAIYMHLDENGNPIYSDTPGNAKAEMVTIQKNGDGESSIHSPFRGPSPQPFASSSPLSETAASGSVDEDTYTEFKIISPLDSESIQNADVVQVKLDIKPELQQGDKIQLMLDNKPTGEAVANTSLTLSWVNRGMHQLSAVILDENQKVVKNSNSITIYIHRVTTNSPSRIN